MADMPAPLRPADIRAARADRPRQRDRDVADALGISEAALVAAHVGVTGPRRAWWITPDPASLADALARCGPVMALTRNRSAVHEVTGRYGRYEGDAEAGRLLGGIALEIRPHHWQHAFAVELRGAQGTLFSLQVFDGAGQAVHKVYPQEAGARWAALLDALGTGDGRQDVTPEAAEAVRMEPSKPVGAPLPKTAIVAALEAARADQVPLEITVGNPGAVQRFAGRIASLMPMGPWQNVMDPGFNLHLRADHLAEARLDPGEDACLRGFDEAGSEILRLSGGEEDRTAWQALVSAIAER